MIKRGIRGQSKNCLGILTLTPNSMTPNSMDSSLPVTVSMQSLDGPVIAIAAGGFHSLALLASGGIEAWGDNHDGQLGDGGTNSPRVFPVNVTTGAGGAITVDAAGPIVWRCWSMARSGPGAITATVSSVTAPRSIAVAQSRCSA
jgi:hypothetical protein